MIINNNISALNAYRNTNDVNARVEKSMEKLSSGLRINRAGDDAAGLAISEKMRGQIKGLGMATKNSQDGISMIQTAEGALNETHSIVQRMRELAVQSANDTNTADDRSKLQLEVDQLVQEINRIGDTTEFNTRVLMDGEYTGDGVLFHIGANKDQNVDLTFNDMRADALGIGSIKIDTQEDANNSIKTINDALESVSTERAKYGAMQNRLEHTINNLRVSGENLQAAESRIRDADMASEMVKFSKDRIISESGTSMLAQANTAPQSVLQLLG
ncbi:MAG: flagellin [Fusobacteriaceae bacterium]|nr:flagellin [Fusobacteriaceae bacterium]MBN2839013.1 flagellin [Fusobacteriaceae bacterium]